MATYTAGPWNVGETRTWATEVRCGDYYIALCYGNASEASDEDGLANATLIAAAPELLEVLEKLVSTAEYGDIAVWDQDLDVARSVISKAKAVK